MRDAEIDRIELGVSPWALDNGVSLRHLYDVLVGFKICDRWRAMLELPTSQVREYYEAHPLGVEDLFHAVHKEYDIPWGPEPVIVAYEMYC